MSQRACLLDLRRARFNIHRENYGGSVKKHNSLEGAKTHQPYFSLGNS
jgi:hypothetical protein